MTLFGKVDDKIKPPIYKVIWGHPYNLHLGSGSYRLCEFDQVTQALQPHAMGRLHLPSQKVELGLCRALGMFETPDGQLVSMHQHLFHLCSQESLTCKCFI
jgi:hypothetical protein